MGLFDKLFGRSKPEPDEKSGADAFDPAEAPTMSREELEKHLKDAPENEDEDWQNQGTPQEMQPAEVRKALESDNPPVLLDVREVPELSADGYIPGSVHIPMSEIQGRVGELDPAKPTVVYCRSGMRSFDVGFLLIENGFKDVSNLNGGILEWDGEKAFPQ
ncbi:MAG: rhodanese-like domain-containing protein [Sumerlaeia bacterium]